jgi:hypothetical protein
MRDIAKGGNKETLRLMEEGHDSALLLFLLWTWKIRFFYFRS